MGVMLASIAVLLLFGLVGGFAPLKVSQLSQSSVDIAYAFAGGILAAVAVVHMLDDAGGELEASGQAFAQALGGGDDAVFPMANTLFMVGFFAILSVEATLHHKVGGHAHGNSNEQSAPQVETGAPAETGETELLPESSQSQDEKGSSATGGWATLVGLSIHSVVEGVAAGAIPSEDQAALGAVVLAIACHKGFAAFAVGSVNLPMINQGKRNLWNALVVWFAVSGPLGMLIGMAASENLDSTGTAVITALAAGTLLSVGVTEMLLPAFKDGEALGVKIFAACFSMLAMSLLAVWA